MAYPVIGRAHMMVNHPCTWVPGRRILGGKVLIQRAAQEHIQDLKPPADAEYRLVLLPGHVKYPLLQFIPGMVYPAAECVRLLPIQVRIHILPPCKQEPGTDIIDLFQILSFAPERDHERDSSCPAYSFHISRHHPDAVLFLIKQRHYPDYWFHTYALAFRQLCAGACPRAVL